jgi:uncharacterized membrane protein (Fun14 family)
VERAEQTMSNEAPKRPQSKPRLQPWVKALVSFSIVLMAAGVVIPLVLTQSLTPGAPLRGLDTGPAAGSAEAHALEWSPTAFRVGFSFFVAFAMAFSLRTFFKFALVALGFFFLATFGLQHTGMVEVNWTVMEERYTQVAGAVERGASEGARDLAFYLPSAAAALVGLAAGLVRRR